MTLGCLEVTGEWRWHNDKTIPAGSNQAGDPAQYSLPSPEKPFQFGDPSQKQIYFLFIKVSSLQTKPPYLCVSVCLTGLLYKYVFLKQLLKNISHNRVCKVKAVLRIAC